jgi:hypothetical protein
MSLSKHPLQITIEPNIARETTICTWEIAKQWDMDTPPPPVAAVVGDDWISLQTPHDANRLTELGYFELHAEGLAMKFLRLAWLAAHHELRQKQQPFDGDPKPFWLKGDDND